MKVVAPRVSTASRRRTRACCVAISWAPCANDSVTVGSSPSGTSATETPTPNRKASAAGRPSSSAATPSTTPVSAAMNATTRTTRFSCSGQRARRDARRVAVIEAIEAMVVLGPVADTTARASPGHHERAGQDRLAGLARDRSALAGDHRLVDGKPSRLHQQHVGGDAVPRRSAARRRRRRGPGPARRTPHRCAPRGRSLAAAPAAPASSGRRGTPAQNAKRALSRTMTTIATDSSGMPASSARPAPTHSNSARRWVSWRANIAHGLSCAGSGRALAPSRSRRRSTSVVVSPESGGRPVVPGARCALTRSSWPHARAATAGGPEAEGRAGPGPTALLPPRGQAHAGCHPGRTYDPRGMAT